MHFVQQIERALATPPDPEPDECQICYRKLDPANHGVVDGYLLCMACTRGEDDEDVDDELNRAPRPHQLRIAISRCRSLLNTLEEADWPDANRPARRRTWCTTRRMHCSGRELFSPVNTFTPSSRVELNDSAAAFHVEPTRPSTGCSRARRTLGRTGRRRTRRPCRSGRPRR